MSSERILAVVVTYNGEQWIRKCIGSLEQSRASVHALIIDNGSTDDTVSIVKSCFPSADVVESAQNLGFGQANNLGFGAALESDYDYVFLLNQDAWIEHGAIEAVVACARDNGAYGIISPVHLTGDGDALDYNFSRYVEPPNCPSFYSDVVVKDSHKWRDIYECRFVNAAAWLVPVDVVREVGGFDPLFFHYGEDANYISRVRFLGKKIGVCPRARVRHDRQRRSLPHHDDRYGAREKLVQWTDPARSFAYYQLRCLYVLRMVRRLVQADVYTLRTLKREYRTLVRRHREIEKSRKRYIHEDAPFLDVQVEELADASQPQREEAEEISREEK